MRRPPEGFIFGKEIGNRLRCDHDVGFAGAAILRTHRLDQLPLTQMGHCDARDAQDGSRFIAAHAMGLWGFQYVPDFISVKNRRMQTAKIGAQIEAAQATLPDHTQQFDQRYRKRRWSAVNRDHGAVPVCGRLAVPLHMKNKGFKGFREKPGHLLFEIGEGCQQACVDDLLQHRRTCANPWSGFLECDGFTVPFQPRVPLLTWHPELPCRSRQMRQRTGASNCSQGGDKSRPGGTSDLRCRGAE